MGRLSRDEEMSAAVEKPKARKPKGKKFDLNKAPRYLVRIEGKPGTDSYKAIYSVTPPEKIATPFGTEVKTEGETPLGKVRG